MSGRSYHYPCVCHIFCFCIIPACCGHKRQRCNDGMVLHGELIFNMLVLVGAVKMADRVVREMMGL